MAAQLPRCRSCQAPLQRVFADLGATPLANRLVAAGALTPPPARYPLRAMVCERCWLVQLDRDLPPDALFSDYLYFSSYSTSWLDHARRYCEAIIPRLALGPQSQVVEVASNDGYLLKNFVERGIPCLGIEPAANVAAVAVAAGVPTIVEYFGSALAQRLRAERGAADLVISNNVLAHVPDIADFVAGVAHLLTPTGTWTVEFPHLLRLIAECQFDTIYHEHMYYLSLVALEPVLERQGLVVVDVEQLATHGGSLRLHVRPKEGAPAPSAAVAEVRLAEREARLAEGAGYEGFQARIASICDRLRRFLAAARGDAETVVAYGAAAKGATLLDVAGVGHADIEYVCDRNPHKQGLYLPGSGLPVVSPSRIAAMRPNYVLVLPWNLAEEIGHELAYIGAWGGKLVRAVPELVVWDPPR